MIKKMGRAMIMMGLAAVAALAFTSCVGTGKLWIGSSYGENRTIKQLVENFSDYHVHYASETSAKTTAILFDPKDDDKKIVLHEFWTAVEDPETLDRALGFLVGDVSSPNMYKVIGPDKQLYGYMYSLSSRVLIKKIDDHTLWVDDLSMIPEEMNFNFR